MWIQGWLEDTRGKGNCSDFSKGTNFRHEEMKADRHLTKIRMKLPFSAEFKSPEAADQNKYVKTKYLEFSVKR